MQGSDCSGLSHLMLPRRSGTGVRVLRLHIQGTTPRTRSLSRLTGQSRPRGLWLRQASRQGQPRKATEDHPFSRCLYSQGPRSRPGTFLSLWALWSMTSAQGINQAQPGALPLCSGAETWWFGPESAEAPQGQRCLQL